MTNNCKIIMYHYVRPIKNSEYSEIKGLEIDQFQNQIEFFRKNFHFGDSHILFDSIESGNIENNDLVFLTFDDGLKDHYNYVFPILKKEKIQGLFFPPAKPIEENIVLDVHKIHFILASVKDKKILVNDIFERIHKFRKNWEIEEPEKLWKRLANPNRFDSGEVIFLKRILQRELPKNVRETITQELFDKYVTTDEAEFAKKLYLSLEEIKEMSDEGMYFGSHSYSHEWLAYLDPENLDKEIKKSWNFCKKINSDKQQIMCYPYGNHNSNVIEKLLEYNFKAGLTTDVGDAILNNENAFNLRRYDTNDFPQ